MGPSTKTLNLWRGWHVHYVKLVVANIQAVQVFREVVVDRFSHTKLRVKWGRNV